MGHEAQSRLTGVDAGMPSRRKMRRSLAISVFAPCAINMKSIVDIAIRRGKC
jgi:hypothetical protein